MSLEKLLSDMEIAKKIEQDKQIELMKQQHDTILMAKDQEIAALKEEINTLRRWLDSSALPALNPISDRSESLELVKMNFGDDKPCPELWNPGEKVLLESVDTPGRYEKQYGLPPIKDPPVPERQGPSGGDDVPKFVLPEPSLPEPGSPVGHGALPEDNQDPSAALSQERDDIVIEIEEPKQKEGIDETVEDNVVYRVGTGKGRGPISPKTLKTIADTRKKPKA